MFSRSESDDKRQSSFTDTDQDPGNTAVWESFGGDPTIFFNFPCFYPSFNITFPIKLDSEVVLSC